MSKKELRDAFFAYLNDYFTLRDFEKTKQHFSHTITGFGSSQDEQTYTYDDFKRIFKRDINTVPNPIDYSIIHLKITTPRKDIGLITCEMDIKTTIEAQSIRLRGTRYTLAFIKHDGTWKIEHKHLSMPSQVNEDDEPYPIKELEARTEVLERMVNEKTAELNRTLKEASFYANHDYMTALPNRKSIDHTLKTLFNDNAHTTDQLLLALVDIDDFKTINDTYGHLIGDNVLKIASNLFKDHIAPPQMVGRWGGDEFILILPKTPIKQAKESLAALPRHFSEKVKTYGIEAKLSIGATKTKPSDTIDTILTRCDNALYQAKSSGKNKVTFDM